MEEEQRAMGGSEDEMIKNLIKQVGMKRKRQADRTLNNVKPCDLQPSD